MAFNLKKAAVVSATIPVNYRPSLNPGISEKMGTIFSVIKLATPGSFIFPIEISHSEQQRLKMKDFEL